MYNVHTFLNQHLGFISISLISVSGPRLAQSSAAALCTASLFMGFLADWVQYKYVHKKWLAHTYSFGDTCLQNLQPRTKRREEKRQPANWNQKLSYLLLFIHRDPCSKTGVCLSGHLVQSWIVCHLYDGESSVHASWIESMQKKTPGLAWLKLTWRNAR